MDIYNSYLRGVERKLAIFDANMSNNIDKLSTMYEMVSLKSSQIYKDIETKAFLEGTDMDGLTYMYQEAEEDAVEKKKGIIAKIFDWFKKIFAAIREKIGGLIGNKGDNDDVEVPSNVSKIVEAIKKHFNSIKMALIKIKNGNFIDGVKDLSKAVFPEIALVAGATVIIKRKKIKEWISSLKDIVAKHEDTVDGVKKAVDKEKSEGNLDEANKSLTIMQRFLNLISEFISKLINLASKAPIVGKLIKGKKGSGTGDDDLDYSAPSDSKEDKRLSYDKKSGRIDEITAMKPGNDDYSDYHDMLRNGGFVRENEYDDYLDSDYSLHF